MLSNTNFSTLKTKLKRSWLLVTQERVSYWPNHVFSYNFSFHFALFHRFFLEPKKFILPCTPVSPFFYVMDCFIKTNKKTADVWCWHSCYSYFGFESCWITWIRLIHLIAHGYWKWLSMDRQNINLQYPWSSSLFMDS